jgi:hypothetical protein
MGLQVSEQLGLFSDPALARAAGERGMDAAYQADRVQIWKAAADGWLRSLAPGQIIRADDLTSAVGLPDGLGERDRPNNVVGAWFSAQAKRKLLVWTGGYAKSVRVVGHGNPQRLWRVHR